MATELRKRVMTGVLGAAALLGLLIYGGWAGVYLLTGALALAMIYEFSEIVFSLDDRVEKRYALLFLTWLVIVMDLFGGRTAYEILVISFLVLSGYFLIAANRHPETEAFSLHFKELMFAMFGLFYLVMLPLYLPWIHGSANGVKWTIAFLLIVWSNDTGAYFAGKKYGRRKLYPRVSPKKTIEGSVGGLAVGILAMLLYKLLVFGQMSWLAVLIIPILVGAVSQVGDLVESLLKRAFDKKDSGGILPGHGGVLDRFDGVVFSLPVMYACIRILG